MSDGIHCLTVAALRHGCQIFWFVKELQLKFIKAKLAEGFKALSFTMKLNETTVRKQQKIKFKYKNKIFNIEIKEVLYYYYNVLF